MNKQQLQQEIEALQKQLEEKQKALAAMPDKWEPKGGDFTVHSNGEVGFIGSVYSYRIFGVEYATFEQAEKAAKAMRAHNRLLAYVAEFAPDYKFKFREKNWSVFYNEAEKLWVVDWITVGYVGVVFMPRDVANDLCRKLNSGEVEL